MGSRAPGGALPFGVAPAPAAWARKPAMRLGSQEAAVVFQFSPATDARNPSHRSLGRPLRRLDHEPMSLSTRRAPPNDAAEQRAPTTPRAVMPTK